MAGYSHTTFTASDRASSGQSDNYHLGVYGATQWGKLALRTGAAYTWYDIHTERTVSMPGLDDHLSADNNAGAVQAFGELGYGIDLSDTRVEPRSEEHTSELQSLMRTSYAVCCLKKKI